MCYKPRGDVFCVAGGKMDSGGKKEFVRTAIIVVFFLVLAIVLLDLVIGNSMDPAPPKL